MVLTCRELPLRPEQVWMGISGASTELVITCIAKTRAPWLTIAVPLPRMCWRGMAVASKQAGRRHASCQVENIKDNNNYSRKKNLHWLQKAKSRGLGALLITLKEAQTKHHCKSPLPRLFPGPMEKMRFKG